MPFNRARRNSPLLDTRRTTATASSRSTTVAQSRRRDDVQCDQRGHRELACAPGHSISAISRAHTSAALASKSEIVAGTLQVVKQPCRQWFPLPASGAIRLTMAHALFMGRATYPTCRSRKPARKCRPTSLVGRQCETAQSTGDPDDPSARSPGQSSCLPPVIGVSGSSPRDHAISSNRPRCPAAIPCKGNFARDT